RGIDPSLESKFVLIRTLRGQGKCLLCLSEGGRRVSPTGRLARQPLLSVIRRQQLSDRHAVGALDGGRELGTCISLTAGNAREVTTGDGTACLVHKLRR